MKAEELLGRWSAEVELFEHWAQRPEEARQRLLADLAALDPGLLVGLRETLDSAEAGPSGASQVSPGAGGAAGSGAAAAGRPGRRTALASGRTAF
jgi:hypothetical protein